MCLWVSPSWKAFACLCGPLTLCWTPHPTPLAFGKPHCTAVLLNHTLSHSFLFLIPWLGGTKLRSRSRGFALFQVNCFHVRVFVLVGLHRPSSVLLGVSQWLQIQHVEKLTQCALKFLLLVSSSNFPTPPLSPFSLAQNLCDYLCLFCFFLFPVLLITKSSSFFLQPLLYQPISVATILIWVSINLLSGLLEQPPSF